LRLTVLDNIDRAGGFALTERQMRAELVGERPHCHILRASGNAQLPVALCARFRDQLPEQEAADATPPDVVVPIDSVVVLAGLSAIIQYALIVACAATIWNLNSPEFAPFRYGYFNWSVQISRVILMLAATVLSTTVVFRVQRLLRLSTCDRMTGLFNRGYFDERVLEEVSRASRYNRPLTLVMIDIDHFKTFNDSHGHSAGDEALRILASINGWQR
jgi:hypothetical protein